MTTNITRYNVFVGVTPAFEGLLEAEARELGLEVVQRISGGIEVRSDPCALWSATLRLRLAESLRVRIGRFAAHNFGELQEGLRRLPWAAYFPRGTCPTVKVTARKSALYHTDAVAERALEAIAGRLAGGSPAPTSPAAGTAESQEADPADLGQPLAGPDSSTVHVRLERDVAVISVDAAGELLHRRGYRTHVGQAPLRETLAAACLRALGIGRDATLWDPFCGSGTLVIEHAAQTAGLPAATGRRFAFESWPTHDAEAYAALVASLSGSAPERVVAIGSDLAAAEVDAARHNAAAGGVAAAVELRVGDFEAVARDIPGGAAIVTNLPYGARSGDRHGVLETYRRFGALLRRRRELGPVGVLVGHEGFRQASGMDWTTVVRFRNRGLPVELLRLATGER